MIDAELLRRAQSGDWQAIDELLARHRDELLAMAQINLGDRLQGRVDASDVVQQTCLSVFQQMGDFSGDEPAQFAAWIRQILIRNIQNAIREHVGTDKRSLEREDRLGDRELGAPDRTTASEHAIRKENSQKLAEALEQLPPDERAVLELRYLEGWTLQQVAEYAGLTKDAVIWRMQKGMQRVRAMLRDTSD